MSKLHPRPWPHWSTPFWWLWGKFVRRGPVYDCGVCPNCLFPFEWTSPPWIRYVRSGVQGSTPDSPEIHWFEAVVTCPRCRHRWDYADSN